MKYMLTMRATDESYADFQNVDSAKFSRNWDASTRS